MKKKILPIIFKPGTEEIRKRLQEKANEFANGNLSAWCRHAGLMYEPPKGFKVLAKKVKDSEDFF